MQEFFTKRSFVVFLISILVFVGAATFYAPSLIHWYATPLIPQNSVGVSCGPTIEWALNKMIWVQLIAIALGALVGIFLAYKFRTKAKIAQLN